ncbi:hypothetical protein N0V95_002503 [Ascochyta clinopodiicola]|nr:hypothetical protein N0V95_002503 [Ascochyta clinopodiicola]
MSDYPSHEHIPRTPKAYMSEAAVDGEQYGVYYNNDTGGGQSTGVDSGDLPGYSQRPPAYGYNQWEYQSQPSYQQPPLYSTARQIDTNRGNHPEYNEQAERGYRVQYHQQAVKGAAINPALPTTARPVPNDMYHSAGCDDQILAIGEQFSQSVGLSESANESQGPQNVAQSNTGHQVDTVRAVDELYDTDIDARTHFVDSSGDSTANRRRYKPAVDEEESILISTVLGRAHGYQASLVHAMRQVPTHQSGHPSGLSLAIASPVDPALGYNQTATVPPPAFDAFPATQQSIAGRFGQVVDTSVPGIFLTPSALGNLNRLGSDFPTE